MKLELKHLAPYLPYQLKMVDETMIHDELWYCNKYDVVLYTSEYEVGYGHYDYEALEHKPILRPLSDLTKEIEHNEEKFVPTDKLAIHLFDDTTASCIISGNINGIPYWVMEKLFEWHFDVFRLIDEGLAININKLNI